MRHKVPLLIGAAITVSVLLSGCSGNDHNPAGYVNNLIDSFENRDGGDGHKAVQSACQLAKGYNTMDRAAKEKLNGVLDSISDRYGDDPDTVTAVEGLRQAVDINGSITEAAGEGAEYACEGVN